MDIDSKEELSRSYVIGIAVSCIVSLALFLYAFTIPEDVVKSIIPIPVPVYYQTVKGLVFFFLILAFVFLGGAFPKQPSSRLMRFGDRTLWLPLLIITVAGIIAAIARAPLDRLGYTWAKYVLYGELVWFVAFVFYSAIYRQKESLQEGFIRIWRALTQWLEPSLKNKLIGVDRVIERVLPAAIVAILAVAICVHRETVVGWLGKQTLLASLIISLIAGGLIFLLGLFWPVIPKSYRSVLLCRAWGKGVLGQDFVICYGTLIDSRLGQRPIPHYRYIKRYHNGRQVQIVGPWGDIVGDCEIRSASYIINTISPYRKKSIAVEGDAKAYGNLNRTFLALGSSSSNEITDLILHEPNNEFLDFGQRGTTPFVQDKKGGKQFIGFQPPIPKDYGLILKIPNLRFPGHFFFVCAGLGEWGTSGAARYLATNWRDLQSKFGNAFGIVVEVDIGSDESARRVFP